MRGRLRGTRVTPAVSARMGRCTLCDGAVSLGTDAASMDHRADAGGLGPWLLVRVSAITNAWIHEQCARWSPEVYDLGNSLQVRGGPPESHGGKC